MRGLRYPVSSFLELSGSGMTHEEVLADYPDLEDLRVVLSYAVVVRTGIETPRAA